MRDYKLEYRLWKDDETYVPLYFYEDIELDQILARRECEFFVKDGVTYKQLSSAIEGSLIVIYVELFENGIVGNRNLSATQELILEIRQYDSQKNHPLLESRNFMTHADILVYIGAIYIYTKGQEWERDSAELDEDRLVYIMYVTPTGYLSGINE